MNELTFLPTDYSRDDHCSWIAEWENDPEIRHLLLPQQEEATQSKRSSIEQIRQQRLGKEKPLDLLAFWQNVPIGNCNLMLDPNHRLTREGKVAWPALVVGNRTFHRKGIATQMMLHLEERAREAGAIVMEAGVFEFNLASQQLVRKLGYIEIGRAAKITFWNGKHWHDIRFAKKL